MDNTIIKNKYQKMLSITICSLVSYQPIVVFINIITNSLLSVGDGFVYDTLLCYIVLLLMIVQSLAIVIKNIKPDIILTSFAFLICYLISYLVFYENREFMFTSVSDVIGNPIYIFFVLSYSGYIFTRYISNYSTLDYYLKGFSIVVILSSTVTFFLSVKQDTQPQYMVFSYNMLVHTIYLFIEFVKYKKIPDGIISILGMILIIIGGARGPILVSIFTIITYFLLRKEKLFTKVVSVFLLMVMVLIIYINFDNILGWLIYFVEINGIESRTLKLISVNNFLDSSGRDTIYKLQTESITMLGSGLFGDRAITNGYAHNIIIELLVQFGYVIGLILIFMVVIIVANGIISKNNSIRNLSIIFMSSGFLKLFLSGSYLNQEPCFYILLGLGANSICERMIKKNENSMVNQYNLTTNFSRYAKTNN